jgi:peptidoglycan/LPS O-acetylase OafA/YrhL
VASLRSYVDRVAQRPALALGLAGFALLVFSLPVVSSPSWPPGFAYGYLLAAWLLVVVLLYLTSRPPAPPAERPREGAGDG